MAALQADVAEKNFRSLIFTAHRVPSNQRNVNRRSKFDPASASNFDPFERRVFDGSGSASSELAGVCGDVASAGCVIVIAAFESANCRCRFPTMSQW